MKVGDSLQHRSGFEYEATSRDSGSSSAQRRPNDDALLAEGSHWQSDLAQVHTDSELSHESEKHYRNARQRVGECQLPSYSCTRGCSTAEEAQHPPPLSAVVARPVVLQKAQQG